MIKSDKYTKCLKQWCAPRKSSIDVSYYHYFFQAKVDKIKYILQKDNYAIMENSMEVP